MHFKKYQKQLVKGILKLRSAKKNAVEETTIIENDCLPKVKKHFKYK